MWTAGRSASCSGGRGGGALQGPCREFTAGQPPDTRAAAAAAAAGCRPMTESRAAEPGHGRTRMARDKTLVREGAFGARHYFVVRVMRHNRLPMAGGIRATISHMWGESLARTEDRSYRWRVSISGRLTQSLVRADCRWHVGLPSTGTDGASHSLGDKLDYSSLTPVTPWLHGTVLFRFFAWFFRFFAFERRSKAIR